MNTEAGKRRGWLDYFRFARPVSLNRPTAKSLMTPWPRRPHPMTISSRHERN